MPRYSGVRLALARLAGIRGSRDWSAIEWATDCWGDDSRFHRLIDYGVWFCARRPVAVLVETYGNVNWTKEVKWVDETRSLFAGYPVRVSTNHFANLGSGPALCMVITRDDAPPVKWLDAQLAATGERKQQ